MLPQIYPLPFFALPIGAKPEEQAWAATSQHQRAVRIPNRASRGCTEAIPSMRTDCDHVRPSSALMLLWKSQPPPTR